MRQSEEEKKKGEKSIFKEGFIKVVSIHKYGKPGENMIELKNVES
jgi:hypothetical protein